MSTKLFSGDDIGFRVEAVRGKTPLGRFVVRVDGTWVEVQVSGSVIPVK